MSFAGSWKWKKPSAIQPKVGLKLYLCDRIIQVKIEWREVI